MIYISAIVAKTFYPVFIKVRTNYSPFKKTVWEDHLLALTLIKNWSSSVIKTINSHQIMRNETKSLFCMIFSLCVIVMMSFTSQTSVSDNSEVKLHHDATQNVSAAVFVYTSTSLDLSVRQEKEQLIWRKNLTTEELDDSRHTFRYFLPGGT